jgi:hypothetical protein
MLRGDSTLYRERAESVARELASGRLALESGRERVVETRGEVLRGWNAVADLLKGQGEGHLAHAVRRFADRMPPVGTEREWIAEQLRIHAREQRSEEQHRTR